MKTICTRISDDPQLIACEYDFALDAIRQKNARVWIDIQDAETSDLEEKLDDINVQGLFRRLCLESRDHPGFYPMRTMALMVIPVKMENQDSNIMEYLALIFCHDFLISIRKSNMARFQKQFSSQDSFDLLPDGSIAGVISSLIMGLSLLCLRSASGLSDRILNLEEQLHSNPNSVKLDEISNKISELLTLESIVQGQLPIIEAFLSSNRSSTISENSMEYLIWAAANHKAADKKLEWLEHRMEVMSSIIEMKAQERINRRLGRLTVLSMIFMPITFLAGIWGMNFRSMPLLSLPYGYAIAICLMFSIAGGMFLYYRRKGWFN